MKAIRKPLFAMLLVILSSIIIQCKTQTKNETTVENNFVKAEAPDAIVETQQGYILEGLEHGLAQSPINIVTKSASDASKHNVVLNYKKSTEDVINLGHTIQVNYDKGNTISFDGKTFDFKQFHFHTPSEHLIDGMTYPMELHMVHTLHGLKKDETPVYLVVGILFKEGEENLFLNEFMNAIPSKEGAETINEEKTVDINHLLSQAEVLSYYNYQGSLTTPPYTETVTWLLMKHIFEASPEQIKKFNKLEGNNARHVQALYGRQVDSQ